MTALNCPANLYGDPNQANRLCVLRCNDQGTNLFYGDNTTKLCQTTCTKGFKYDGSKICVSVCPVN